MKSVVIIQELVKLSKAVPPLYVPCFIFDGIMILKVVQPRGRERRATEKEGKDDGGEASSCRSFNTDHRLTCGHKL
jgi:hypothetical protein